MSENINSYKDDYKIEKKELQEINQKLVSLIDKPRNIRFKTYTVDVSPSYSKSFDIKTKIPVYIRPINDKKNEDFGLLYVNTKNKALIADLKEFLKEFGLEPDNGVIYDGYMSYSLEIGFSQFVRRWIPNAEERLIQYLQQKVTEKIGE